MAGLTAAMKKHRPKVESRVKRIGNDRVRQYLGIASTDPNIY